MQNDETVETTVGFTAALDDVPHEVSRLLEDLAKKLTNSAKEIKAAADKYDISEGELEFFENYSKLVRSKIAITKTDRRLHEVLLILSGWYEAVHSELGLPAPAEDDKLDIDQILEQTGAPEGEGDIEIGENEE